MRSSATGFYGASALLAGASNFVRIFAGVTPIEGVKVKRPSVASENLTSNQPYHGNGARYEVS